MNLSDPITLHQGPQSIQLPLVNILRISMIHLTKLRKEYEGRTNDHSLAGFWQWIERELGMGKGIAVLT